MSFELLIEKHRKHILETWFSVVAAEYAKETTRFLVSEKDPFNNPVGSRIQEGMTGILHAVCQKEWVEDDLKKAIDAIVRVRAVQSFSPSESLRFLQKLKFVIRDVLAAQGESLSDSDFLALNLKIDAILFVAFDIYVACREQIYQFKASYVKDRTTQLLKKANILCEVPEVGTDIIPSEVYKQHMENK